MPQIDAPISPQTQLAPCPCGSEQSLGQCCLPLITGEAHAQTAEQLMRSRYTAHALLQVNYLWHTWDSAQRARSSPEQILDWAKACDWLRLDILATQGGQSDDSEGTVSFAALYRQNGKLHQHQEVSLFRRLLGRWVYVDHLDA